MDEQPAGNIPPPPAAPAGSHARRSPSSALLGVAGVLVLVVIIAGAAYVYGGFAPHGNDSSTAQSPVAWKSIIGTQPVKTVIATSTDEYTDSFDLYTIGTFTSGAYAGSSLEIGLEKISYSGAEPFLRGEFIYFIADSKLNPVGWWGDYGAFYAGVGGFESAPPIGLDKVPVLATTTLPAVLYINPSYWVDGHVSIPRDSNGAPLTVDSRLTFPPSNLTLTPIPNTTFNGNPILRAPDPAGDRGSTTASFAFDGMDPYQYFVQTPFGLVYSVTTLAPSFLSDTDISVPNVTWSIGSTTVQSYNYGRYAYGVEDCYSSFQNFSAVKAAFIQTGTTVTGDPLYEVNPKGHDDVYRCLYEKSKRYDYNPDTRSSTSYYPQSYAEFPLSHPMFFWQHPYGDWVAFGRMDVVPAAEKGKPVIYLYPTKTENVSVQVNPVGGFTKTDPAYGSGWNVLATPESVLTNLADGKTYPYLFWEGGAKGVVSTPKEGFVAAKADIPALLDDKLALLGLNAKERADFKDFWVPKLSKAPYYFVTFVPQSEMDRVAPMTVSPAPDSVIRVLMDYHPLSAPTTVAPLTITTPKRTGFTVVEWGGLLRD